MTSRLRSKFKRFLDMTNVMSHTKNLSKLNVTLKKTDLKGIGVYATNPIKKGDIVAHYKLKIFDYHNHDSPTNFIYTFDIYDESDNKIDKLIGDIDLFSLPRPQNGVPFWGPFINEPSKDQKINVNAMRESSNQYKVGDTIIINFIAITNIEKEEELTWYYGKNYPRNYEIDEKTLETELEKFLSE